MPTESKALVPVHVAKDLVIQRLTQADTALAECVRIDQVKLILDVAAAQEVFARRQQLGEQVLGYAHTVKTRALSRLGELLKDMEKAEGGRPRKTPDGAEGVSSKAATLDDLGISYKVASIAQQLAALPEEAREAIAQKETTLAKVRRENRIEESKKAAALPDAKFRVLYADPPWEYSDKADEGAIQAGGASRHYPMMSMSALCALPIESMCEPDAVLFLWVTSPLLFDANAVIDAWGFEYKASFVWDKIKHNMGHYNSVRHEFLLVCTRGSCVPDTKQLFDSVQSIERTTHSTKPEEFRNIIDTLYPHGKRLELFARKSVEGWESWGNEA